MEAALLFNYFISDIKSVKILFMTVSDCSLFDNVSTVKIYLCTVR